jgi:hypothetical protein
MYVDGAHPGRKGIGRFPRRQARASQVADGSRKTGLFRTNLPAQNKPQLGADVALTEGAHAAIVA